MEKKTMNKKERERLLKLRQDFYNSELVCDPLEFFVKKKNLLNILVQFLLEPLEEVEAKEKIEEDKKLEKFLKPKKKQR